MSRPFLPTLLLGVAFVALAAPAQAQEASAGDSVAAADEAAGEIVVTARRRAENVQDVPIAVTAYSGEALENQGALDITDIADTTPNVTLETSRGTNSTLSAFIRGVGQQDPVAGFEQGVGLYLDDVYLNRPQAGVLDIYDVERIEVLRGPQGTLYGRNTIGGAIKYVTRRLPDDFSLNARVTVGTYHQIDTVISASAPVTEGFRIGASAARLSRGGFGDNLNIPGVENYNKDLWAFRATIEMEPTDAFSIRFSGDYSHDRSDPRNGHRLITSLLTAQPVLADVYDTRAGLNTPTQDIEAFGGAIHADLRLGDSFTIRNIAAYREDRTATSIDFDALLTQDVDVPAIYSNHQFSNELQLLYEGDRLKGVAGFYYLNAE